LQNKLFLGSDNEEKRFFLEAGAFNGVTISNTLALEMKHKWTGLLIEPDPVAFEDMKSRY
jgi:hypothetical protein